MKKIFFTFLFGGILVLVLSFFLADISLAATPEIPTLISPKAGAINVSVTPTFQWSDVNNVEWYNLYVFFSGNELGSPKASDLDNNYYELQPSEALTSGTTYLWMVRACNSDGCRSSKKFQFSTIIVGDNPPTVTLSASPSKGEVGQEILIAVRGDDEQGVTELYVKFGDEVNWYSYNCSETPCMNLWEHTYSNPGNYTIQAYSLDTKKQKSEVSEITVNIGGVPTKKTPTGGNWIEIQNPLKYKEFDKLIDAILQNFFYFFAPSIAVVMFVIAGFMFVTSAGDPGRVKKAKDLALWTAIGLAIILLASGLIKVLQSIIGVTPQ